MVVNQISDFHRVKEESTQLKFLMKEKLESASLEKPAEDWIKGVINILDSKVMIKSNIDDIIWFHKNGMNNCQSILDLGCGGGYLSLMLSRFVSTVYGYEYIGKWVGQQYGESNYEKAFSYAHQCVLEINPNLKFCLYKKFPLNLGDESLDGVVLYAVLEHLDKSIIKEFFSELKRILKPGGYLFIAKLPRKLSYQEHLAKFLKMGSHDILYDRNMANNILSQNGFEVKKIEKTGLFFNHPNKVVNPLFPITSFFEDIVEKHIPSLEFFSHDYRIVAKKK